jgi:hypothetical protein
VTPLLEPSRRTSSRSVRKLKPAKALQGWWAPAAYSDGDGRPGARGPGYARLKWSRVPGLTLCSGAGQRLCRCWFPTCTSAVLRQNPNLLETINFSAGHLYRPTQSDKVVTRIGIATAASLPGRLVKCVTIRVLIDPTSIFARSNLVNVLQTGLHARPAVSCIVWLGVLFELAGWLNPKRAFADADTKVIYAARPCAARTCFHGVGRFMLGLVPRSHFTASRSV